MGSSDILAFSDKWFRTRLVSTIFLFLNNVCRKTWEVWGRVVYSLQMRAPFSRIDNLLRIAPRSRIFSSLSPAIFFTVSSSMDPTAVGHRSCGIWRIIGAWMARVGTLSVNKFNATLKRGILLVIFGIQNWMFSYLVICIHVVESLLSSNHIHIQARLRVLD